MELTGENREEFIKFYVQKVLWKAIADDEANIVEGTHFIKTKREEALLITGDQRQHWQDYLCARLEKDERVAALSLAEQMRLVQEILDEFVGRVNHIGQTKITTYNPEEG